MNINPNTWSCLPTSVANVIGMYLSEFIAKIGHDGSALPYDNGMRAGFHVQECIRVLDELGWSATPFEFEPSIMPSLDGPVRLVKPTNIQWVMQTSRGFLCGQVKINGKVIGHAVSNFEGVIYNPVGAGQRFQTTEKFFDLTGFVPEVYYKVAK